MQKAAPAASLIANLFFFPRPSYAFLWSCNKALPAATPPPDLNLAMKFRVHFSGYVLNCLLPPIYFHEMTSFLLKPFFCTTLNTVLGNPLENVSFLTASSFNFAVT